jgi:acyl-coenzyme A synthetase/AMP-(fatty) acid ligase
MADVDGLPATPTLSTALALGVTTTVFESTPVYPTASRYWDFVDKWKATQLYTAPPPSVSFVVWARSRRQEPRPLVAPCSRLGR